LLLGKIQPHLFPAVFGKNGTEPLSTEASVKGFQAIANDIKNTTGTSMTVEGIAEGFLAVAVEHMARAIKRVSVERGHNIKDYTLLTFGGAGGQHACLVADALAIETVLVPPFAGVLSALGMGLADQRSLAELALETPIANRSTIVDAIKTVSAKAERSLEKQGVRAGQLTTEVSLRIKYAGTDTALSVPFTDFAELRQALETLHQQQFGFVESNTDLIVEAVEAEAVAAIGDEGVALMPATNKTIPFEDSKVFMSGETHTARILERSAIGVGEQITGPAIIMENGSTTVIELGWQASATTNGSLLLRRVEARASIEANTEQADPILLEIFNNLFMSVAEEMGAVLAKTAHSVNVKERLDFSCAVFDEVGRLIANAPHMPVHLGSMGESVTAIITAREGIMKPGDVFMINDPSAGGTHLPDITIVTPVFLGGQTTPAFYVASRGHHADIGGLTPGSMPPNSQTLEDEGICFTNFHLVEGGNFQTAAVLEQLNNHRFPARNPAQNIADLKAQVAANARGASLVHNLIDYYGIDTVSAYMTFVRENAAEAVRSVIATIKPGKFSYSMDCGATIAVKVIPTAQDGRLRIDFTGTSDQMLNNYNAPYAVVKAAVLYVFRVLAGGDIPLNDGCLDPIDIIVPSGSMLKPNATAAVVAGNVETSQAITNALFLATSTMAASQGTMNNLTFGNETYQYYETIAGGTGAGKDFDGTDAIQSHMTNSRMTDVEVLEWRYPVLVNRFGVRKGSGGLGQHVGGNGIIREFEFLEPMEVSLLANHYSNAPPGLNGGEGGHSGKAEIIRSSGETHVFKYADSSSVNSGDKIVIETPGGGGFGESSTTSKKG
jgi:5-oxoprolinase (ATP-hydrolysing)